MAQKGVYSAVREHARVPAKLEGPSMTRQEFADECDINTLMARYEKTGVWPMLPSSEPVFFDATELPKDFREAMDMMLAAQNAFMTLPAHIRKEFDNDARLFVDFAQDADNLDQMREWGLAPPAVEAPAPAPAPSSTPEAQPDAPAPG